MLKIFQLAEAQNTILKRVSIDDMKIPSHIQKGIQSLFGENMTPDEAVRRILQEVRIEGDLALQKWSTKLDGLVTESFRVPQNEIDESYKCADPKIIEALNLSADRIRHFCSNQPINSWILQNGEGTLGQLVRPIKRVGIYVPGGTAPLPSTILMSVIPAQVAGVEEIVLMVPPDRATGKVAAITLATAALLGVNEIYSLGGAQAIAAMAFGTQTIQPVDKIFGPGNLFVTLAKRQVFGTVGVDGLAGPTETMIIADETANSAWIAADLLAQAEHDVLASAILLTTSQKIAEDVQLAVESQLITLPRREIIEQSLQSRSGIVVTQTLQEAIVLANTYAPEHLCLSVKEPLAVSEWVTSAGGIFVGDYSCEVLGDYIAGPSHVMPTSGTARFASPLNLWDFVHIVSLVALNGEAASRLSGTAAMIARSEGLEAHARAADARMGTFPKD